LDCSVRDSIIKCTANPSNPITQHKDQVPTFDRITYTLEQAVKTGNLGARWGGWSTPRLGRIITGKRDPFYRK
jgi:hypothetical protein